MSTPQLDASVWVARDDSARDTRRLAHIVRAYDGQARRARRIAGLRLRRRRGPQPGPRGRGGRPGRHPQVPGRPAGPWADAAAGRRRRGLRGDALEAAQDALGQRVAALLGQGARPLVLGGGHEIAWGSFQGLARWLESRGDDGAVLVLNLDAHFDLRTGRPGSSGTPFDQIASYCQERGRKLQYACLGVSRLANTPALFARADEVGAVWVEDRDMGERHLQARLEQLDDLLAAASHVYLTIDLDVLPAAVMPGVSAPAPYGVPMAVVEEIALRVKASGKLRLADMAEYNPRFDVDGHGARAAARLAWQLLSA